MKKIFFCLALSVGLSSLPLRIALGASGVTWVVILGLLIAGSLGKVEGRATNVKRWTQQQWKASSKGGWPRLHLRSRQWTAGRVGRNFADNDTPAKVPPLLFHRKAKQERSPSTSRREKGTWGGKTFSIVPMRVLTNGGNPPKRNGGMSPPHRIELIEWIIMLGISRLILCQ